ncbi:hypothetical protein OT109_06755 [Phycisphaeraceae bacterium D3-23]
MTRLIRSIPLPMLLVLLAMMPAAMGMARGIVRCEHADASAHLAAVNHHEQPDADANCCCGDDAHSAPDPAPAPADHPESPCDDTPIEIEPAPTQLHSNTLDLPDAPLLPVTAWLAPESALALSTARSELFDGQPPGIEPGLLVVDTTIFRL